VQLLGVAFDYQGLLSDAYVPLDSLTAIIGPNDSGKTSALRRVADALRGRFALDDVWEPPLAYGAVFYKGSLQEIDCSIASTAETQRVELFGADDRRTWSAAFRTHGRTFEQFGDGKHLPQVLALDGSCPCASIVHALSQYVGPSAPTRPILDAVVLEPILCALLEVNENEQPVWNAWLCLPPSESWSPDVEAAVSAFRPAPKEWPGVEETLPWQLHREDFPHMPLPIIWVGEITRPRGLPEVMGLPRPPAERDEHLSGAVTLLLQALAVAVDESVGDLGYYPGDVWTQSDEESARPAPDLSFVCSQLSRLATLTLPPFVSDRYSIEFRPPGFAELLRTEEPVLHIELRAVKQPSYAFAERYLAAGLQLWVDLAVADVARRVEARARQILTRADEISELSASDPECATKMADELAAEQSRLREELRILQVAPVGMAAVVIVDEPERHLHPAAQRQAAKWLRRLADTPGSTVLLATHAPGFAKEATRLVHAARIPGTAKSQLVPADDEELGAASALARDMGWDRGELLVLTRVILFVEGIHDEQILRRLFGPILRSNGVIVTPIHGVTKIRRIPESRLIFELLPAVQVAVLVDRLGKSEVEELAAAPDEVLLKFSRLKAQRDVERAAVAQLLLETPRQLRNRVKAFYHGAEDVLVLFDDQVLKAVFPRFPGRAEAARSLDEARSREPELTLKRHWHDQFGVQIDDASVQKLIAQSEVRSLPPSRLAEVIEDIADWADRRAAAAP